MKRALPYILSFSLLAYLIIVLTFAKTKLQTVKCKGLQVTVDNKRENAFVEEEDIRKVMKRHYGELQDLHVALVDKDSMEHVLARNAGVKSAEVYYDLNGYLHIDIVQRRPVLRVMADRGYYVDEEGRVMSLSGKYTSRVVVATGHVSKEFACGGLYRFVMGLRKDEFWDALVEQIVVERGDEIILIPKVGNFRIVLGTLEGIDRKMANLRLFFEEGIALKGWNTYKEINLKFDNQIVCVKR